MDENPYQASQMPQRAPQTQPTWWLIWFGLSLMAVAAVVAGVAIFGMVLAFDAIATSADPPEPAELAQGISTSVIPMATAIPLGMLGLVLLIVGLVARQPVE